MKYTQQVKLTAEYKPTEECIIKRLAAELVTEMPIEELKKLVTYNKVDPDSKESQELMHNSKTPNWKKQQIHDLDMQGRVFYSIEVKIPDLDICDLDYKASPLAEFDEDYLQGRQILFNRKS